MIATVFRRSDEQSMKNDTERERCSQRNRHCEVNADYIEQTCPTEETGGNRAKDEIIIIHDNLFNYSFPSHINIWEVWAVYYLSNYSDS